MRREAADLLLSSMVDSEHVRVVTADLGFGVLDQVRAAFPERFYNVGAAEFTMAGVAVGMANEGVIPVCYSMSSFLLYRPFELLRNYVNHERIPVKLIGSVTSRFLFDGRYRYIVPLIFSSEIVLGKYIITPSVVSVMVIFLSSDLALFNLSILC